MEPWREEELRQRQYDLHRQRMPRCVCCGEPIWTELYLDLTAFGLKGYGCEACMEENTGYLENLEPEEA